MKNYLSLFILILFVQSSAIGVEKYYTKHNLQKTYIPWGCCYADNSINKPHGSYRLQKNSAYSPPPSKKIRKTKRLQNKKLNRLSFLFGKNNQGNLTGYSVPISKDIYKQMGITPYDMNTKIKVNSPTCNTELFSTPSGTETYYKNGEKYTDLKGISGKTGVSIIYD